MRGTILVWRQQGDVGSLGLFSFHGWQQSVLPDSLSYLTSSIYLQL